MNALDSYCRHYLASDQRRRDAILEHLGRYRPELVLPLLARVGWSKTGADPPAVKG